MANIVQEQIDCVTAEEFLDALSPIGKYFKNNDVSAPWLFRGQGKDYPLIPSLFRKNGKISHLTKRNTKNYPELLRAERDIIIDFFEIADRRGFIIPDDSQELRSDLYAAKVADVKVMNGNGEWLRSGKVLSLVAMAQHYGIPTRLLDWTLQPFIASFFAADGGTKRYRENENTFDDPNCPLVVWAFYFPRFYVSHNHSIKGVTAPGASNPNLKAQQGVFTLVDHGFTNEKENDYLPFENILENIASGGWSREVEDCELRKFTVPVTESFKLLRLLRKLDIAPSSIYPSYQSIISDIENQRMWGRFIPK